MAKDFMTVEDDPEPFFDGTIDYYCGARYRYEDVRGGAGGTVVIEPEHHFNENLTKLPEPIAGPVARFTQFGRWYAGCESCGWTSKPYKRMNEPAMRSAASRHRCGEFRPSSREPHLRGGGGSYRYGKAPKVHYPRAKHNGDRTSLCESTQYGTLTYDPVDCLLCLGLRPSSMLKRARRG